MRHALAFALALLVTGCRSEAPAPAPDAAAVTARDTSERLNLLNVGYGASVVSRTAELDLEHSALRAIDGESVHGDAKWMTVANDTNQTLVFGLPAPARIEQFGITTQPGLFAAGSPRFEVSMDGRSYTRVPMSPFEPKLDVQLKPLQPPVEARYVRLTLGEGAGPFATLISVQARGRFSTPPAAAPIAGCWTINGLEATFVEESGEVRGAIGEHRLHGGRDGGVYRFAWSRGPNWGHALITLSPDGTRLSGMKWYEEPIAYNAAESWFGEKCRSNRPLPDSGGAPRDLFAARRRAWPLYGNAVETVVNVLRQAPSQRLRLVSREYHGATADENRRVAQKRLDELRAALAARAVDLSRIEFVAAGSDTPHQPIENESMRVLYGVIEIAP